MDRPPASEPATDAPAPDAPPPTAPQPDAPPADPPSPDVDEPAMPTPVVTESSERDPGEQPGPLIEPAEDRVDEDGAVVDREDEHDDDDEWFDLPPERAAHKWVSVIVVLALIVGVAVGGAWFWYQRQIDPPGSPGATVEVTIPPGSSTSGIGSILESEGVIANATVFSFYAGRKGAGPFEAGTYRLRERSDLDLVLATLAKGPTTPAAAATVKVTIPEGYTVAQILERIHQKVPRFTVAEMQAALDQRKVPSALLPVDATSYEGVLFPATYQVGAETTPVQLLTLMAAEMETRAASFGLADSQARIKAEWGLDLSAYDMLKVASMIQSEAAVPADAPKIGAVTYNRLKAGMPLQYDSTSVYEAGLAGKDPATIDYTVDTPYSTRTNTGLPPTPVSAPGEYAIGGAMEPATGPWLYFVLTDAKEVTFTVTYEDFLAAKALCKERDLGCG